MERGGAAPAARCCHASEQAVVVASERTAATCCGRRLADERAQWGSRAGLLALSALVALPGADPPLALWRARGMVVGGSLGVRPIKR